MGDDDGGRCGEQCHKERCSDPPVVIIPLCASQDYPCVVIDYPPEINLKCFRSKLTFRPSNTSTILLNMKLDILIVWIKQQKSRT